MFHRAGGTLAPWDPPVECVVWGPYLYTRNPMMTGILLIITAEGILLGKQKLIVHNGHNPPFDLGILCSDCETSDECMYRHYSLGRGLG